MSKSEKIRLYYGIFLSVLTAAVGIVFIVQAANLYYSGLSENVDHIYALDRIRPRLVLPLIFLCIWVVAIVAGYVLSVVFPITQKRKAFVDNRKMLTLLKPRMPLVGAKDGFDKARDGIIEQEIIRAYVWTVAYAVLLAGAIAILIHTYNPANFNDEWRPVILSVVRNTMGWVAAGLICCIAASIVERITLKREVEFVKRAIATGDRNSVPQKKGIKQIFVITMTVIYADLVSAAIVMFIIAPSVVESAIENFTKAWQFILLAALFLFLIIAGIVLAKAFKKYVPHKVDKFIILGARVAVAVVAIAFIIAGIYNGGHNDVWGKAVKICTECIGLG